MKRQKREKAGQEPKEKEGNTPKSGGEDAENLSAAFDLTASAKAGKWQEMKNPDCGRESRISSQPGSS